ncbi:GNAT family N-acetyltransferase [Vibrio sp. WZ-1]|jgi:GNAT superfamily N-acetyltransferase|uniref:GNAT family N-acetyltransferase n=1 Tax=Vibrio TaxID=662 RepID=UPI003F84842C
MISIEKYTPYRHAQTIELQVLEEQVQFTVDNIGKRLESLKSTELPHLICEDDCVVGFFLFDAAYSEDYDFCPQGSLGVRSLLVDHRYQGKGIAKQAISQFADFAKLHYPTFEFLYLTVNCRNVPAYQCYLKAGFEDTHELYHGGPVGPQHIMRQAL